MFRIQSKIDTSSPEFQKQKEEYLKILTTYKERLASTTRGGPEIAVKRHKERGKLLARERIDLLVDKNTPFIELSPMAAYNLYNNEFPSAGVVTGIGVIHEKEVMIVANDATVKGGSYTKETIKKHVRAQEIAMENRLPCVYLVDSGGVFLPEQANVFPDKYHFGRFFFNQARLSSEKIPQIAVVMGSCTAGGAYVPAMSDETIIVRNQGTIFIGGPPLVKAATGETVTAEELGGGEVHTMISGVADHLAENDIHAIQICRNIFESIDRHEYQELPVHPIEEPYYDPEELYGILPIDVRKPIDSRELIARIVDGSLFHEFKEKYAPTLVTGFTRIMGYEIGILANNGVLFSDTARKGAHFIELCTARNIPLLFLQNITGFIVGKQYEHGGIARDGAKFVHATANANVPKFTVIFGGSFGAGNYAMAGRAYEPRFLFMYPNSKISVMGGEQASQVLITVKEEQLKARGEKLSPEDREKLLQTILKKYEEEGSAYFSTARLWDDGIIDPVDTRKIIGLSIAISQNKKYKPTKYGVFRM
ncbi:MAG: methylcrotonoyl-CoA carboxylase [Bacteroidales bacterium]|nr:methylcrotonoyl-CoA carboxylase [Bacteroidales bacterium]